MYFARGRKKEGKKNNLGKSWEARRDVTVISPKHVGLIKKKEKEKLTDFKAFILFFPLLFSSKERAGGEKIKVVTQFA